MYASVSKGAYVLEDAANPQVILIGTGSEVSLAMGAAKLLAARGNPGARGQLPELEAVRGAIGRVQGQRAAGGRAQAGDRSRRDAGLVEVCGPGGDVVGLERFGASAPGAIVMKELGFSPENVAGRAKRLLKRS